MTGRLEYRIDRTFYWGIATVLVAVVGVLSYVVATLASAPASRTVQATPTAVELLGVAIGIGAIALVVAWLIPLVRPRVLRQWSGPIATPSVASAPLPEDVRPSRPADPDRAPGSSRGNRPDLERAPSSVRLPALIGRPMGWSRPGGVATPIDSLDRVVSATASSDPPARDRDRSTPAPWDESYGSERIPNPRNPEPPRESTSRPPGNPPPSVPPPVSPPRAPWTDVPAPPAEGPASFASAWLCAGCGSDVRLAKGSALCWGCGRTLCVACYWRVSPFPNAHRCPACAARAVNRDPFSRSGARLVAPR